MKFSVTRSIDINSPISDVKKHIEDFSLWALWSPWTILEPSCKIEVQGDSGIIGHSMMWEGKFIGSGKNVLIASNDNSLSYDLEFYKPWKSQASVSFLFESNDDVTRVSWKMDSSMPFFMFFMIKTMRNMIAMDYDRGLRMLKALVEDSELKCLSQEKGTCKHEGFDYIGIKRTVDFEDMPQKMAKDFEKIVNDVVINGKKSAQHWVTIYPKFDLRKMQATYIAAISSESLDDLTLDENYTKGTLLSGNSLEISHTGSYDFIGNAWSMGMMLVRGRKLKARYFPFEQYWNSPFEVPPEELQTSIFFPYK